MLRQRGGEIDLEQIEKNVVLQSTVCTVTNFGALTMSLVLYGREPPQQTGNGLSS